ncbi:MAG: AMP-binding protein [Sedimenticolaceae bacterium]
MYSPNPPTAIAWPALLSPRAVTVRWILTQMAKTERQPPQVREAGQRAQLHSLLTHAQRHVPFYQDRLGAAGFRPDRPLTEDVWRRIPILTRQEVQQHAESLRANALPPDHGKVFERTTSGSTGVPLRVLKTELVGLFWDAVTARDMLWQERDRTRPWHSIRFVRDNSAAFPEGSKAPSWGRVAGVLGPTGPGLGLDILTDPGQQIEWLQRSPPSYLLTYPSNLKALLQATASQGRMFPDLQQVITISESLPADLRETCREQWGVPICDMYSATELGYIAIQAPHGDHYMVPDEVVRVELLDDAGDPVNVGEVGRVVVTPLHNYAMPLVRYQIGDYAERGDRSPCGRTLPVINRILGRVRNMLSYPDGRKVWPLFSDYRFRDIAPVRQFRVIQREIDALELQVAAERELSEPEREALAQVIRERVSYPFRITVTEHAEIARSAGGKFEDFRNEVAPA